MSDSSAPPSPAAPLPAGLLQAWLEQSHDLVALTDATGRIRWCNPAFERAAGIGAGADLLVLVLPGTASRRALEAALKNGIAADSDLALRSIGGVEFRVDARVLALGGERLFTLRDTTEQHAIAARAQHLSELLDMAQEFGRLGVWERDISTGVGRWDKHVFSFWGMSPDQGTPDHRVAVSRIHPDDRTRLYADSIRRAGRYSQRFRVMQPDGSLRWIHAQWEVKNSAAGVPARTVGILVDDSHVYELARSRDAAAAQLRVATELADIVVWRHDLKTSRVHYNDHGFKVLGLRYRPGGLSLEEARSHTHPDDVPKLAASTAHALATGVPIDVEVRHRREDGVWRYVLVRRVIERDASGKVIAFVGVTLDVTRQVEQARRAEELSGRLEAAAEAAGIGIWTTVVGTRHTEWNAQMYELFDMPPGSRPSTLGGWISHCVHPDDMARVTQVTRAFLKGRTRAFEIEFRIRLRDGRQRWIMLRTDLDRSAVDPTRAFGIAMDVTERHEALEAMRAASKRAALIAHHAGIGTWELDSAGGGIRWDEQMFRLRGLAPQAPGLERNERLDLVHPDDRANMPVADPERSLSAEPMAYEFRVRLPDGSYRWLASRSAALKDEHGQVTGRVGVNWDVTQAKSAELARQQALLAERESQAKSQFLSRMSHELRTPLNAVLGFTQLLQLELAAEGRVESLGYRLGHIRAAGEHLLTLIDDVLDLSSLESGSLRLDLQPVAIEAAVVQAMALVGSLAAAQSVALRRRPLLGCAMADPTRLQQVLLNLLTNAIKYNRAGGEVWVESTIEPTDQAATQVRLRVTDTGRGLDAEQLAQLFEPFNRLGAERDGIEGSGIGLTIVKALVEGMGGQVAVRSEPGQGTVLEVVLPAADQPPAEAPQAAAAVALPAPRRRKGSVLYIEDNSVNVLLVEELIKTLSGLEVVSELTGTAGVERAISMRPGLILIDMQLPDFDGFEVLRRLRARPETASIRCIALSANAMPDDINIALAAGFDDYWTKPIRFQPFLDALDSFFSEPQPGVPGTG